MWPLMSLAMLIYVGEECHGVSDQSGHNSQGTLGSRRSELLEG